MKELRNKMATTATNKTRQLYQDIDKLTALIHSMATKSPKKHIHTSKTVQFEANDESDSDNDDQPTPPPKKRQRKAKRGKFRSTIWIEGKPWKPGMIANPDWEYKRKVGGWAAKKQYCMKNPE